MLNALIHVILTKIMGRNYYFINKETNYESYSRTNTQLVVAGIQTNISTLSATVSSEISTAVPVFAFSYG